MTITTTAIDTYKGYISRIVDWNKICENKNATYEERLNTQYAVVIEEITETLAGLINNDKREIIDGIADVLVTAGYLIEEFGDMKIHNYELHLTNTFYTNTPENQLFLELESILNEIKAESAKEELGTTAINHYSLIKIYNLGLTLFGDEMDKYIEAVLDSNETKYIPEASLGRFELEIENQLAFEVKCATETYAGKHENIVAVKTEYEGNTYYILRSDNGLGKILKPLKFKEPEQILGYEG